MKGLKIGLIVVLSVIAAGLCGILIYGMAGGNIFEDFQSQYYTSVQRVLEEEIPLNEINSISILYGMNSNDIYLFESDNDAVIIREYSNSELGEKEISTIRVDENILEIKGARRSYNNGGFHLFYFNRHMYDRHYTEVYLPSSYQGEILLETASGDIVSDFDIELQKDLSAVSTSGDVHFASVAAENVLVSTSSGYVTMENIDTDVNGSGGEISIKTSSGDVNLKELTGKTKIESSSGYLTVRAIVGDTQLKTSSGDMNIEELTGETKTESSSGNVTIGTIMGNVQINTSSGDVNIQYLNGEIRAVTTSGCVRVLEGDGDRILSASSGDIVVGGTEGSFQINTQSGNVQIGIQKGEGSIETTSGDVQLGLEVLSGILRINSSSGDVSVKLSAENEFEFMTNTGSGDIMTFFDDALSFSSRKNHAQGTYGDNARGNQIQIQTTSGDVGISKY